MAGTHKSASLFKLSALPALVATPSHTKPPTEELAAAMCDTTVETGLEMSAIDIRDCCVVERIRSSVRVFLTDYHQPRRWRRLR